MKLELPTDFIQTVRNTFGGNGKRWLESLPALLEEASRRWELADIQPVPNLSYSFVAVALSGRSNSLKRSGERIETCSRRAIIEGCPSTALRSAQERVILKLGVPNRELTSEIATLQHYDGRGACRLYDADAEKGMLLLERLQPGVRPRHGGQSI